ncbi:hypothetical protein [Hugenholtzia roseola]|uniref:hypothetical protein n=1 Tax=Hugenholtzia roseola TaxID=1002 RepID=UPI00041C4443|nr:hypothetical protein [Hugenholtzia roseola]
MQKKTAAPFWDNLCEIVGATQPEKALSFLCLVQGIVKPKEAQQRRFKGNFVVFLSFTYH